jgi:hypothetical protein
MAATRGDLAQNNWDDFGVAITSVNRAKTKQARWLINQGYPILN